MRNLPMRARQHGITLMELMVVLAIVGILSAIAIPAYRQHVVRVTRTDAKRDLMNIAQRLERCFTRSNDYEDDGSGADCVTLPQANPEGTYQVSGELTTRTFTLTATPLGGQASDAQCGAFTLNQLGQQGITGTGTAEGCWSGRRN